MKTLKTSLFVAVMALSQAVSAQFSQHPLSYGYDAFENVIDAKTMEIHYTKHAAGYVNNLNKAIKGTSAENVDLVTILKNISKFDASVRNNAGGHYNHELFWSILTPKKNTKISKKLEHVINETFGSVENMKEELNTAASNRFGSGWAWLCVDKEGNLFVTSTPNQDNPLMDVVEKQGVPILGIDVWEHAYYLKYQNKRIEYLHTIWDIINWDVVSKNFEKALKELK